MLVHVAEVRLCVERRKEERVTAAPTPRHAQDDGGEEKMID